MGLPKEAVDSSVVDYKITEDFLHRHNLQVTKHFENTPTLVWAVESIDYPLHLERPEAPIVLTRLVDKQHDTISIRVNRSFSELTSQQQILSVYYMGQLSYEQGSLDSVTLAGSLRPQTIHTIVDVLRYSKKGNSPQLIEDLGDDNGWVYMRYPRG